MTPLLHIARSGGAELRRMQSANFDTRLTLSILRNPLRLKSLNCGARAWFDTSAVYRGPLRLKRDPSWIVIVIIILIIISFTGPRIVRYDNDPLLNSQLSTINSI